MKINIDKLVKDTDNVSITGYRIISILKMLIEMPCGEEDINSKFLQDPLVARSLSKDTVCIYINTLRAIGCEIVRPSKKNNYKYVLKSHPFDLSITMDEVDTLIELRQNFFSFENWSLMLSINNLIKSIISKLDPSSAEYKKLYSITKHSSFLSEDKEKIIYLLERYCSDKRTISINYNSPNSGEKLIEVIADYIAFENGCFYLWCYNTQFDEVQYLRIDRISEIKVVKINLQEYESNNISATYKLSGMSAVIYEPEEIEEILDQTSNCITIKTRIDNRFRFIQKILSFGADCVVLSPDIIKQDIHDKLISMKNVYNDSAKIG